MGCCSSQLDENETNHDPENYLPTEGNKPLRKKSLTWTSDTPLTLEQLKAKRDEFWETAPTYEVGRREIWQRLRTVCETTDLSQAQSIVDSLRLSVPTGHLSDGCYDELGNRYIIPIYCFAEPANLIRPTPGSSPNHPSAEYELNHKSNPGQIPTITITEHAESEPYGYPMYMPQTSTSTSDEGEELVVRLSTGKDIRIKVSPLDNMEVVKSKVCGVENVDPSRVNARFFYMGKMLNNSTTIQEINVPAGGVIQALVALV
ncbi:hypothetical protein K493DRAFT_341370 [Basidiobolus meristosporus CBS 931.73]|uniref:Ubiquitin-like domain-containing protein n=1 Tax=Basidiobolus meristosporus CBS 931.73 TaxID=1314790 RepID=A0A1Y1XS38_9FUNG|nr:hypothetical protein K493DRAFT_341370 [Basidiobolus meristosporus CBS 931.73]|eukprot:ORX88316.1 hypothetical protein K493DRAFT_341370 [Basidiobolus meristosporus CBS 931.73]